VQLSETYHRRVGSLASSRRIGATCSLAAILLFGCACRHRRDLSEPRVGATELELLPAIEHPVSEGYEPARSRISTPPVTLRQELPSYPEAAIADEIRCEARLLYHIETDGTARLVRLEWDLPPPDERRDAFESAIRNAVAGWEFVPSQRWTPVETEDGSTRRRPKPIPKAGRALVRFRVVDGTPIVE
jgi:hypothetical protein